MTAAARIPETRTAANDDRGPLSDDQAYNLGQRYHLSSVGVRDLAREIVEIGRNPWKEAVLDALAAWPGMDFPIGTPPREIIEAVLVQERDAAVALAPPHAPNPLLAGIQRVGNTIYALNARECNRWTAQVQPGFDDDDDDKRISDEECVAIAEALTGQQPADEPMTEPFMVTGTAPASLNQQVRESALLDQKQPKRSFSDRALSRILRAVKGARS